MAHDGGGPGGGGGAAGHRTSVVVPAGGGARRLGGVDKVAAPLAGRPLLEHLLAGLTGPGGLPAGVAVAVVGPPRALPAAVGGGGAGDTGCAVLLCREDPPGGGPAAAVGAGAAALTRRGLLGDVVVVLPGDAPWSAAAVPALLAALGGTGTAEAAVAVDAAGRRQVLVAAHRAGPLVARLERLGHQGGGLAGTPASRLLPAAEALVEVAVDDALLADVDTPEDLAAARRRAREVAGGPAREARPDAPA